MKVNLKNTSLAWKGIANMWNNYFTVPSRISKQEVNQYKQWLKEIRQLADKNKKPLSALVLGATPELRDALSEFGYEISSIDINKDMFLAMDQLLKSKDSKEKIVIGNWLENNLPSDSFDVILGDAVLPNIPWSQRIKLLKEVKRLLKPNGIFLTRAFCVPGKKPFKNVEEILEHFSKKDQPIKQSALEMVLEFHILAYDKKDHLGSFAKAKAALEEYHRKKGNKFKNKKLQEIHDIVWNFWCKDFVNKVFVYAYRAEEEKEYKKYFKTIKTFEAKDHDYSKITPMYFLRND
jgi:SAM-dependent methyltransferase